MVQCGTGAAYGVVMMGLLPGFRTWGVRLTSGSESGSFWEHPKHPEHHVWKASATDSCEKKQQHRLPNRSPGPFSVGGDPGGL